METFKDRVRKAVEMMRGDSSIKYIKIKYDGKRANSEADWHKVVNPIGGMWRAFVFQILRKLPPMKLKNSIYRMFGVKIGKDAAIAYNVFPDPLYPEFLEIGDGTLIGSDLELSTHEFTNKWFALGRTKIGKNCMIGGYVLIKPGTTIGDKSMIGILSYVNKDVPANEFWAGIPAKLIKQVGVDDTAMHKDMEIYRYEDKK